MDDALQAAADGAVESIRHELAKGETSKRRRASEKFFVAALSAIPWVGAFIAAGREFPAEEAARRQDDLRGMWLEEHERKLSDLRDTLEAIDARFLSLGPEVQERIESPEFLALVRQAFRTWDQAETDAKRTFVANLVANSGGTRLCSDDIIRLFISWLALYHESHFAVIREIHQNPASTRFDMWFGVYGGDTLPRDDSAEADLYKMLIRDLSTGGVIRQIRESNDAGQFTRKRPPKRRGPAPSTLKSAFDDHEAYVLTDLGKQFVQYTFLDVVRRIEAAHG